MVIDATFWVAISFIIFVGGLIYLKVPQKISLILDDSINLIKNEIEEAEKIKNETKKLLSDSQIKIDNAQKESQEIIENAKAEGEKMIININEKFSRLTIKCVWMWITDGTTPTFTKIRKKIREAKNGQYVSKVSTTNICSSIKYIFF